MKRILQNVNLTINEKVYLKDPESSELGRNIIAGAVDLIDEIGFENFTFKKLSISIKSSEASIYRYFENKHSILLYLMIWYYEWLQYRLVFKITNIDCSEDKLKRAISLLTSEIEEDSDFSYINQIKLDRIISTESSKIYLNKSVTKDNAEGFFKSYKDLVQRVSDIILEVNPTYKYPHMLVSTIIEGAHHQRFFSRHLPKLTDVHEGEDSIVSFYLELVKKVL
mgnify:CR=1 FL=1